MDDAEWTREGSLNAVWQVGADGLPPLSWNAHVGVWLSGRCSFRMSAIWVAPQKLIAFVPEILAEMQNMG